MAISWFQAFKRVNHWLHQAIPGMFKLSHDFFDFSHLSACFNLATRQLPLNVVLSLGMLGSSCLQVNRTGLCLHTLIYLHFEGWATYELDFTTWPHEKESFHKEKKEVILGVPLTAFSLLCFELTFHTLQGSDRSGVSGKTQTFCPYVAWVSRAHARDNYHSSHRRPQGEWHGMLV